MPSFKKKGEKGRCGTGRSRLADDKNRQFSFDARDRPSRTNKNLTNNCITIISYVNLRAQMNGKPLAECRNVRKEKSRFCISAPDLST